MNGLPAEVVSLQELPDELLLKLCDSLNERAFKEHCVFAASANFRAIWPLVKNALGLFSSFTVHSRSS